MRDQKSPHGPDDAADDCPDAVRDLLPELLHGRLAGAERARVEAHVAGCAACDAELTLLGGARATLAAAAPAVDVHAIAAAVRAATIAVPTATRSGAHVPTATPRVSPAQPPSVTRASRWRIARSWSALAATVLLAVGSGAVVVARGTGGDAAAARAAQPAAVSPSVSDAAPSVTPVAGASAPTAVAAAPSVTRPPARPSTAMLAVADPSLGTGFDDLSDDELQAVLDAVTGDEGALPNAEPEAAAPAIEAGRGQ